MFTDLQARQDLEETMARVRRLEALCVGRPSRTDPLGQSPELLRHLEMRLRSGEAIDGVLTKRIERLEEVSNGVATRLGDLEAALGATQEAASFLVSHLQQQVDDLEDDTQELRDDATKTTGGLARMEEILWKFAARLFVLEHPEYAAAVRFTERRSGLDRRGMALLTPYLQHRRNGQRRRVDRLT